MMLYQSRMSGFLKYFEKEQFKCPELSQKLEYGNSTITLHIFDKGITLTMRMCHMAAIRMGF